MDSQQYDWKAAARRLAEAIPLKQMHPEFNPARTEPVAVACSGGIDSVCVLLLVWHYLGEPTEGFHVLHFDHQLRGKASEGDAVFVEQIAQSLGVAYVSDSWQRAENSPVNEAEARKARLSFFEKALREGKTHRLFEGHHLNDIAEGMLMHIAKGSSLAAIAGPAYQSDMGNYSIERPLLTLSKAAISAAMQQAEIPWREDASNAEGIYFRNRIRNDVFPVWQNASEHDVLQGVTRIRDRLMENEDTLAQLAEPYIKLVRRDSFPLLALKNGNAPRAIWRKTLEAWLALFGNNHIVSQANKDSLLDSIMQGKRVNITIAEDISIHSTPDNLFIRKKTLTAAPWKAATLDIPASHQNDVIGKIRSEMVELTPQLMETIKGGKVDCRTECYVSLDKEEQQVYIRPWEPGDRYHPLGAPGSRKLQDVFTDRKIPVEERKRLPVVTDSKGSILWVPGLPPAEPRKIEDGRDMALRLTYQAIGGIV